MEQSWEQSYLQHSDEGIAIDWLHNLQAQTEKLKDEPRVRSCMGTPKVQHTMRKEETISNAA